MELIIDIPEVYYEALKQANIIISGKRSGKTLESVIYGAVGKGTPLTECEDAISRQAVMALAKEECETAIIPYKRFVKGVDALSPVTSVRPKGEWIERIVHGDNFLFCSNCDMGVDIPYHFDFCPNCGCRMRAKVESENER